MECAFRYIFLGENWTIGEQQGQLGRFKILLPEDFVAGLLLLLVAPSGDLFVCGV